MVSKVPSVPAPQEPYNATIDYDFQDTTYTNPSGKFLYGQGTSGPLYFRPEQYINHGTIYWDVTGDYNATLFLANRATLVENDGLIVGRGLGLGDGVELFLYGYPTPGSTGLKNSGSIYAYSADSFAYIAVTYASIGIENSGTMVAYAPNADVKAIYSVNGVYVHNAATGKILVEGKTAIAVQIDSSAIDFDKELFNEGTIAAYSVPGGQTSFGVVLLGRAVNAGTIIGDVGIRVNGTLENSGTITGLDGPAVASSNGVELNNTATGLIYGDILGGERHDVITNAGVVKGDVTLGGDSDSFVNTGAGYVTGIVDLGLGDDSYGGSSTVDRVAADNGDDTLDGGGGDDLLLGGNGDDTIRGGAGNDGLYGERGNDVIVTQGGDHASGGSNDDRIELGDLTFGMADGGSGTDRLVLPTGGTVLDLAAAIGSGRLAHLEIVELRGSQEIVVRAGDAATLSDSDALRFDGTATDKLGLLGSWTEGAIQTVDGVTYRVFTAGDEKVMVDKDMALTLGGIAPANATGLAPIAAGNAPPEPGEAAGLDLTPDYLRVNYFEIFEPTEIYEGETWYSQDTTAPALYAYRDSAVLTVNGGLISTNDVSAGAIAIDFANLTRIYNNGGIVAQSTGALLHPVDSYFPLQREGAHAVTQALRVENTGYIGAAASFGVATALGSVLVTRTLEGALTDEMTDVGVVVQVVNKGSIEAYSDTSFAAAIAAAGEVTNTGDIYAWGATGALGVRTAWSLFNSGSIVAETDGAYSLAVLLGNSSGVHTLVNSGLIAGARAIAVHVDTWLTVFGVKLDNSGEIHGSIDLTSDYDAITNTGLIAGDVHLSNGADEFDGTLGVQSGWIYGDDGDDTLTGGAGDDRIDGGIDKDTLSGLGGADRLVGGAGDDRIDGGAGIDTAVVNDNANAYTVTQTATGVFEVKGTDGTDTLTNVEFLQFDDQIVRLMPGTGVTVNFETNTPSVYQAAMNAILDFDGNHLGGDGSWLRIGSTDIDGDGDIDQILVNKAIGRMAEIGGSADGKVYFDDHGWAGETRVIGIYTDPLVASGQVPAGSANDSQVRFQHDLQIENINRVLGAGDYDHDGLQEVYFALTDGTAYLHAYMHADGNLQYANYQSQEQVISYLTNNGFGVDTYAGWFG